MEKYLKQTLKIVNEESILFCFTEKIDICEDSISSLFKSDYQTFHFQYSKNLKYIGINKCLEYNLKSKTELLDLKKINFNAHKFGLNKNEDLKFFGGIAFNMNKNSSYPWESIPVGRFILPEILITYKEQEYFISFYKMINKKSHLEKIINKYKSVINDLKKNIDLKNNIQFQKYFPNRKEYKKTFNQLIDNIDKKIINKVVLSRMKIFSSINKCTIKKLPSNCTNFHIDFIKSQRFLGSTPEKLIEVENKKFSTHALAGTLRKSESKMDLKKFLKNKKEINEHQYVVKDLLNKLNKLSDNINSIDEPGILELEHLYHLNTPINGTLKVDTHVLDLLYDLYPTPAVLGEPSNQAINMILENENFDRGWYAGCVGWFNLSGDGRFDVSIRSALQIENKLYCFAGSGLINQAIEDYEWNETQAKFQHILSLIN
tara:strand:- start:1671 stop:2963 length:1293 start_codon:yes stop_codon:yes gene_type:complete